MYFVFAMALVFIYLVMAAQFVSWRNPFIIMLSVPLSMTGALFALWMSGGTLSIYSQIGLITLVGLITKHGILIVEFATQLRAQGLNAYAAVVRASEIGRASCRERVWIEAERVARREENTINEGTL